VLRIAATFFREADDAALLDALSAFIRTENFEEREQVRGYLDTAVLEFMKDRR
jgi:Putative peptidoglycan binding domain